MATKIRKKVVVLNKHTHILEKSLPVIKLTQWEQKAEELYKIQQLRKYYEKQEEMLSSELKNLCRHKSKTGKLYSFVCEKRKGTIDYKALVEIENIDVEPYRKEDISVWRLIKL